MLTLWYGSSCPACWTGSTQAEQNENHLCSGKFTFSTGLQFGGILFDSSRNFCLVLLILCFLLLFVRFCWVLLCSPCPPVHPSLPPQITGLSHGSEAVRTLAAAVCSVFLCKCTSPLRLLIFFFFFHLGLQ